MTIYPVPKPVKPPAKRRAFNSTCPAPSKRIRARSKKYDAERVYGSKEFRDFLHRFRCLGCSFWAKDAIAQAHLFGNDGLSRKKGWETTGPLCHRCHDAFDGRDKATAFSPAVKRQIRNAQGRFLDAWNATTPDRPEKERE